MKRVQVRVGNCIIGEKGRAIVQTMCNTQTLDIDSSLKQCRELSAAGARIIRLTTQGLKEVAALKIIKESLREQAIFTPLVADVHFSHEVALAAAAVADKVRINPGNFAKDHEVAKKEFEKLTDACKKSGCAIRIGINHGSLGERIVHKYGDTPEGMKEAAIEWIEMAEMCAFDQIIISLKSSNTIVMTRAYELLYREMQKRGVIYPLHLGVTEAGNGDEGRIKSAVALASLLYEGIGDTIRVSLTENPLNEIPVAEYISRFFDKEGKEARTRKPLKPDGPVLSRSYIEKSYEEFVLRASCELGPLMLNRSIDDINLNVTISGIKLEDNLLERFRDNLLQATRRKFSRPEYIACPGCGRTLFDLEKVFEEVKMRTSHLKGYNIAVMGCNVNGPGEMADADYGYVGEGRNRVTIYRKELPVYRSVPQERAIDMLLELIEQDAHNRVFLPRHV
jgi:(E)-4-hydroxy-3-methylbut-2-enyl-diphosphate synthase